MDLSNPSTVLHCAVVTRNYDN